MFPLPVPLSLVSPIWPCVAHSCCILSSRGTKHPATSLKNRKKRSYGSRFQRSLRLRCCAQREQGSPRHMLPEAPGELDKRHTGQSGRSTNSDLPWTSAPRLPIQDPPNGGWHSKVFLNLQNLAQGPEKPEQQCVSQNCQKRPERMACDLRSVAPIGIVRSHHTWMPLFPISLESCLSCQHPA